MAQPIAQPIVCPQLIGRTPYVEAFAAALESVQQGEGRTVVVSGEAGIGKSRLLVEVGSEAERRGFIRLLGNAFEAERDVPFAPLTDLLRNRIASANDDLKRVLTVSVGHYLSDLLPELANRTADRAPAGATDPEQRKRRLYTTLDEVLLGIARDRPALIAVEDMHWADETTLDYLLHLARQVSRRSVMLVVTYRSDEVHPALRHFLAGLDRERLATEAHLTPLDRAEVGEMLRAIFELSRPPRADLVTALYEMTEGNPFFIEEVLHILVAEGDIFYANGRWDRKPLDEIQIPRSVHDTVQRRALGLSADAARVLNLAAVLGRRWDFALLQTVGGYGEARLLALLKELIAAQLIVEESDERYRFRHALTRQAVYAELLARERRLLHRSIAETIERLAGEASDAALPALAYHYFAAGVWEKAAAYSQHVGERALSLFSPGAAVEHFTRALKAFERLGVVPPLAVLRSRGAAYETLGDFERALADYERALERARADGDWRAEWQTLRDLGMLWSGRDYAQAGESYRRAHELAEASGDAGTIARSLNSLGNWLLNIGRPSEALRYHGEALAAFEALDDRRGIAETLDFLGLASYVSGNLVQGTRYYGRGIALMRDLNERKLLASALATMPMRGMTWQTDSLVPATVTLAEAQTEAYEALAIAREIGWLAAEAYAHMQLGYAAVSLGEYGRAIDHVRTGIEIATAIEHQQWLVGMRCARGCLLLDLYAQDAAEDTLMEALRLARTLGSHIWLGYTASYLAFCYVDRGKLDAATAVLDDVLPLGAPVHSLVQRIAWCARIHLMLARGEPERALQLADELAAATPNAASPDDIPRVSWLRGRALIMLGRHDDAARSLLAAEQHFRTQGARAQLWRVQADLCALALARGEHDTQREASIRDTLAALALNIPDPALRETFRAGAAARLPAQRPSARPAPRRTTAEAPGGLTSREREVVGLVAAGLANRAIAERLVVGERTVESHITNILGKLGFANRAQIAAWAVAHDLAQTRPATDGDF